MAESGDQLPPLRVPLAAEDRLPGAEVGVGGLVRGPAKRPVAWRGEAMGGWRWGGQLLGAPAWDVRGRGEMALPQAWEGGVAVCCWASLSRFMGLKSSV